MSRGMRVICKQQSMIKGRLKFQKKSEENHILKRADLVEIKIKDENIFISPLASPEEFIKRMEGKIKSSNKSISPEEIKSVWKM